MEDLKLILLDFLLFSYVSINFFFFSFLNFINPILQNGLVLLVSKTFYYFSQNMTFFFALKFCFAIGFLVLIRGGTPRYRYDYLTKLGWLKFLSLVILIFSSSLTLFFLF